MGQERVIIISGDLQGREFTVEEPITVGRNPENTIVLDDRQVSRKHAVIEGTRAGTIVKDLGSGNGTFVDGRRILEFKLTNGDVFQIGSTQMRYEGETVVSKTTSSSTVHPMLSD